MYSVYQTVLISLSLGYYSISDHFQEIRVSNVVDKNANETAAKLLSYPPQKKEKKKQPVILFIAFEIKQFQQVSCVLWR